MKPGNPEEDHNWVCRQEEGVLGEIVKVSPLSEGEVTRVEANPKVADEVCPHGAIICQTCKIPLLADGEQSTTIDFAKLSQKLVPPQDS